jgi:hypothetical protein
MAVATAARSSFAGCLRWAHLGVTTVIWLLIPLSVGLAAVIRAEVK